MCLGRKLRTVRSLGVGGVSRFVAARVSGFVWDRIVVIVYGLEPAALRAVEPRLDEGDTCSISTTALEGDALGTSAWVDVPAGLRSLVASDTNGRHLYRLFVNGELAGYGFTVRGPRRWPLVETGTRLDLGAREALLYGFHVLPHFEGRKLYQAMLARMAADAFRDGANRVQIYCLDSNAPSRSAIERVGFEPLHTQRSLRVLGVRA